MIKSAIFDLDGTLLDSMRVWDRVGDVYLENHGYSPVPEIMAACKNMTLEQSAEYIHKEFNTKETPKEIYDGIMDLMEDGYLHTIPLKPGAEDFVKMLHARGVKLCVATATDVSLVKPVLDRCGILDCFEGILTCYMVGKPKTDPEIYRKALEMLGGEKEDAVVFEDVLFASKTAKNDGFKVAGIYDGDEPEPEAMKALCDYYFESWEDASKAFNRCVVVAGADINNYERVKQEIRKEDYIVYCDCGLRHMPGLGVKPDLIVGDFDSFDNPGYKDIETIVLPTEKDDTDSMFAIKEAAKRGYKEFLIAGAIGARLDHTLVNVYALETIESMGLKGYIIDDYSMMELAGKEPSYVDDSWSFFSLLNICGTAEGITIKNAKYCLEDAVIEPKFQYGTSNEVLPGKAAEITVKRGKLLLIKDF